MILSVAIVTKEGTPLVARQFNRLTRTQVEGHLGAFPKLLSKSNQSYIETENIRYVYQELGEVYFILITTKDSNILEDLDLLSLLIDLTRETLHCSEAVITADCVLEDSLRLIFAYDECIFDGYRQNVTVQDVEEFLLMESEAEQEYLKEKKAKEEVAKKQMNDKIKEINNAKKANKTNLIGAFRGGVSGPSIVTATADMVVEEPRPKPARKPATAGKGMTLGKKVTARDRAQQMILEEGLTPTTERGERAAAVTKPTIEGVNVHLTEKCTATISRMGVVEEFSIEGKLAAISGKKQSYFIQLRIDEKEKKFRTMTFKQPQKALFTKSKQLQFENNQPGEPITLLGWRAISSNSDDLPLSIACWVPDSNERSKTITFSCELEKSTQKEDMDIENIEIQIPFLSSGAPSVSQCDGEQEIIERSRMIKWHPPNLDADNSTAALEFSVTNGDPDGFYPIAVTFDSRMLCFDIDIVSVADSLDDFDNPTKFEVSKGLVGDITVK